MRKADIYLGAYAMAICSICILPFTAFGHFAEAGQSPSLPADSSARLFKVNPWISGGIAAAGLIPNYFLVQGLMRKKNITDAELQALNKDASMTAFDRYALRQDPSKRNMYHNYSDYVAGTMFGLPVLLGFDKSIRSDWLDLFMLYLETHSIALIVYNLSFVGPLFQGKYRPIAYYTELPKSERSAGDNRNSMYSGHVSSTAAASFFMADLYAAYHPELGLTKWLLYGAAAVPPIVVGYYRVKSLDHFPSDAGVGFMVGTLCGVLVPEIHRIKNKTVSVGTFSTGSGATGVSLKWEPR